MQILLKFIKTNKKCIYTTYIYSMSDIFVKIGVLSYG